MKNLQIKKSIFDSVKCQMSIVKCSSKAFTLVETLTAMTIIIMAILGPLTVAVYSYSYATETRDNMTATYLAEEAIELLRYKRDSESLLYTKTTTDNPLSYVTPWNNFKGLFGVSTLNSESGCYINPTTHAGAGCNFDTSNIDTFTSSGHPPACSSPCQTLYRDSNFLYTYTLTATSTSFSRIVKMENISEPLPNSTDENYIRVSSLVNYKSSNGFTKKVEVIDFIHRRGLN